MAFSDIAAGALQGIAPLVGSAFGPAGAALGNVLGEAGSNFLRSGQQSQQEQMLNQLSQQMQNPYQFQRESFDPIRKQALQQYNQQILPGIAERFTGMGGRNSSAFRQALSGSANDLASQLAGLESQHNLGQQQAGMQAFNMNQNRMAALGGLLQQQQAAQQAAREAQQGRMFKFASMVPQTMLDQQRQRLENLKFGSDRQMNILDTLLRQQQYGQQGRQANSTTLANFMNAALGNKGDVIAQENLTPLQQALNWYNRKGEDFRGIIGAAAKAGFGV